MSVGSRRCANRQLHMRRRAAVRLGLLPEPRRPLPHPSGRPERVAERDVLNRVGLRSSVLLGVLVARLSMSAALGSEIPLLLPPRPAVIGLSRTLRHVVMTAQQCAKCEGLYNTSAWGQLATVMCTPACLDALPTAAGAPRNPDCSLTLVGGCGPLMSQEGLAPLQLRSLPLRGCYRCSRSRARKSRSPSVARAALTRAQCLGQLRRCS